MQRVLVAFYSNSGDVERVVHAVTDPLRARADIEIVWRPIVPRRPLAFPAPAYHLIDISADLAGGRQVELQDTPPLAGPFDLVILGWQVWWLRPSIPVTTFVEQNASVLVSAPVICVGAARQMWSCAWARLERRLNALGVRVAGSMMVCCEGGAATLLTTPLKLMTGRRSWGRLLPAAVLREDQLAAAAACGAHLAVSSRWADLDEVALLGPSPPRAVTAAYLGPERLASAYMDGWAPVMSRFAGPNSWLRQPLVIAWATFIVLGAAVVIPAAALCHAVASALRAAAKSGSPAQPAGENAR
jgi:hypothetical protein